MNHQFLINKLYLDSTGLDGNNLASILEGLNYQNQVFNLTIQSNTINEASAAQIVDLMKRRIPDNLQELHLYHTRINW